MGEFRRTNGPIVVKVDARACPPRHIIADTIYTRLRERDGRFKSDNPE
jgi:hypothetical protein